MFSMIRKRGWCRLAFLHGNCIPGREKNTMRVRGKISKTTALTKKKGQKATYRVYLKTPMILSTPVTVSTAINMLQRLRPPAKQLVVAMHSRTCGVFNRERIEKKKKQVCACI